MRRAHHFVPIRSKRLSATIGNMPETTHCENWAAAIALAVYKVNTLERLNQVSKCSTGASKPLKTHYARNEKNIPTVPRP